MSELVKCEAGRTKAGVSSSAQCKRGSRKRKSEISTSEATKRVAYSIQSFDSFPIQFSSDYPLNKDGYRYTLAQPDPNAMDSNFVPSDYVSKPIPSKFYRALTNPVVSLSFFDKAPQLKLSEENTVVVGCKGYSMVRGTHGVRRGPCYFEVRIVETPEDSGLRIGWSQKYATLQAPCGYDSFSYSWRSIKGTVFHCSHGKSYSPGYCVGDIIGVYIYLPEDRTEVLPTSLKSHTLVRFKNNFYFEEKYVVSEASKKLHPLVGSEIVFYKNGCAQGQAFKDIYAGTYYPTVSIYKSAKVKVNFGPDFAYPPGSLKVKPVSHLAKEEEVETTLSDLVHLACLSRQ